MDRRMQQGSGAPSFCWVCMRQLRRAPGKGLGLFYFDLVVDQDGREHRVHGAQCFNQALEDGAKRVPPNSSFSNQSARCTEKPLSY